MDSCVSISACDWIQADCISFDHVLHYNHHWKKKKRMFLETRWKFTNNVSSRTACSEPPDTQSLLTKVLAKYEGQPVTMSTYKLIILMRQSQTILNDQKQTIYNNTAAC